MVMGHEGFKLMARSKVTGTSIGSSPAGVPRRMRAKKCAVRLRNSVRLMLLACHTASQSVHAPSSSRCSIRVCLMGGMVNVHDTSHSFEFSYRG
jgi:hypothetical protein